MKPLLQQNEINSPQWSLVHDLILLDRLRTTIIVSKTAIEQIARNDPANARGHQGWQNSLRALGFRLSLITGCGSAQASVAERPIVLPPDNGERGYAGSASFVCRST